MNRFTLVNKWFLENDMDIDGIKVTCLLMLSVFYTQVVSDEVCFPLAGCYSQDEPWVSLLRPLPKPYSPEKIQVGFYLYTRQTLNIADLERHKVQLNRGFVPDRNSLSRLNYDSSRLITVFLIHGFAIDVKGEWIQNMISVYLSRVDANVFAVDWGKGAKLSNYYQTAANIRVVAYINSIFLQTLITEHHQFPRRVHFIGHSLGAQAMGYVGKRIPGIGRGTALDAAHPAFEGCPAEVRLDKTDFEFLDVIHTNGRPFGLGYIGHLGHVDFFMNGGGSQPGCIKESFNIEKAPTLEELLKRPVESLVLYFGCSHSRATRYFLEAVARTDCVMWGHLINKNERIINQYGEGHIWELFEKDKPPVCLLDTCTPVGLETYLFPARGDFFVHTNAVKPYCGNGQHSKNDTIIFSVSTISLMQTILNVSNVQILKTSS